MHTGLLGILTYIIIGGIALLVLIRIFAKPAKCAVCGAEAKDQYHDANEKSMYLCRNHMTDRWKVDFLASATNMLVIEPDFKSCPLGYLYASPDTLRTWQYPKEAAARVAEMLKTVAGKDCAQCGARATVGFYRKDQYDIPQFETLPLPESYLCKKCAVEKVIPLIRAAVKPLSEGLFAPSSEEGVYHVQQY